MFDTAARPKEWTVERGRSKDFSLPDIDSKLKLGTKFDSRKNVQKSLDNNGSRLSTVGAGSTVLRTS